MSFTLFDYTKGVQRLIRDSESKLVNLQDIIEYVNEARRMVARRAQCLRFLTPISAPIKSVTLNSGGSGYTNPQLVISAPDFPAGTVLSPNGAQATGIITTFAGVVTDAEITFGGNGYFQPSITISDPTGSGAILTPNLGFINTANLGQEVYNFSDIDLSTAPPGYGPMHSLFSSTILFSDYRYVLIKTDFTHYQALVRTFAFQYQYVPAVYTQFGQGVSGSIYVYPQPSQTYQMEWDCICDPAPLLFNEDPEAIPEPWCDAVKFYAAHLAFLELQNFNSARAMLDLFNTNMGVFSKAARPSRPINPYGRS